MSLAPVVNVDGRRADRGRTRFAGTCKSMTVKPPFVSAAMPSAVDAEV
jgi:hypothetical protein